MKTSLSTVALAAALLPDTALAQTNSTGSVANEVDDTIVVSATRSGDGVSADLIGASVTLLDADAIEKRQTREVSDILRDVPGVAVNRIAGLTQIRLRGTEGNHTLVLIDGIEASDPYYGEFDLGTLIADEGARIEVLRGQQSALYGSDAIGGVIHYITLTGAEAPGVRLRAEAGSFGTFNAAARVAGVSGDFDYALSATLLSTDGTPSARDGTRDIGNDSVSATVKATWAPLPAARLTVVGRYAYADAEFNNTDFNPTSPTFGLTIDSPGSYYRNEAFYGLIRGEVDLLDGRWTHALSAQIADTERKGYDVDAPSYGDEGRRTKGSYETTLRFGSDRVRHNLTFALDAERERFRNTAPGGYAFTGSRHTDNLGLVGQYDLVIDDRLALGGSLRHDDNDRFDDATTYRLQGSYRFESGTRVRTAAGSGIKNPGFYELFGYVDGRYIGNPNLKPEKSEGWEAGIEQSFAADQVTIGATYFDNELKDEIYTSYPAPLFVATPANRTTRSKQHGMETFLHARLGEAWRIDASYTHLQAREDGVEEVRRPNDIASLSVSWRAPEDRGGLTLVVRYNGEQKDLAYTDPSFQPVRVELDDYTLVNLNADWALNERISLFGRVENLLDEDYEELFGFRTAGRAAYAGVRARF